MHARWMRISVSVLLIAACEGGDPSHRDSPNMHIVITENHGNGEPISGEFGDEFPGCPTSADTVTATLFRASLDDADVRFARLSTLTGERVFEPIMRGDAMELYVTDGAEGFWIIHEDAEPIHIDTSDLGSTVGVFGADLDGDGDQDVIARIRTGGAVRTIARIWERDHDKLVKRIDITPMTGSDGAEIAIADIDLDGFADIVSIEQWDPVVYRGDGAFHFERLNAGPALDSQNNLEPRSLRVADADADGHLDLIGIMDQTAWSGDAGRHVFAALLPGNGHGRFGTAIIADMGSEGGGGDGGFADLDGDGRLDAFTYGLPFDGSPTSELRVALQQTDRTFAKPTVAYTTKATIVAAGSSRDADTDADAGAETSADADRLWLVAGDQLISFAFDKGIDKPETQSQPIGGGLPAAALFTEATKDAPVELVLLFGSPEQCGCGACPNATMCFGDIECETGHCRNGHCVECESNDECADDQICQERCIHAVSPQDDWTALSIASDGGCGITKQGALRCWGENEWGLLPSGSFKALAVTERNSDDGYAGFGCAIRDSGELACWAGFPKALVPEPPSGKFTAIDASYDNACAIGEDGHAVCWNVYNTDEEQPPDGTYTAVSIGGSHTCLVTTDGELRCFGCMGPRLDPHSDSSGNQEDRSACQHDYGQAHPPQGTFDAVAAGGEHTCAIEHGSGKLICFGHDLQGQADPPAGSYRAVAADDRDTCAIDDAGQLVCFGFSGDWPGHDVAFSALSMRAWHRCALRSDGRIECGGDVAP